MNDFLKTPGTDVSICLITYNQEEFIRQCIDSMINQKLEGTFELIIGEDFSTDKTRKICEEYQLLYPSVITLLPSDKNYGMMDNFMRVLRCARGKYVAFCEGDDFWSDQFKLQKQVNFLNEKNDHVVVGHSYTKLLPDGSMKGIDRRPEKKSSFTIHDYILSHFIHFNTLMYRNDVKIPDWFGSLSVGDQNLVIYTSQFGRIGYIPDAMSVYRINGQSFMNSKKLSSIIRNFIGDLKMMNEKSQFKYSETFNIRIRIEELMFSFSVMDYFKKQITVFKNLPFIIKYRKYIFKDGFSFYKLLIPSRVKALLRSV